MKMLLSDQFLLRKAFSEHHMQGQGGESIGSDILPDIPAPILFQGKDGCVCVEIGFDRKLKTHYYVGLDWLKPGTCIYVEPKIVNAARQTDYLKMLFLALQHPETAPYTKDLFQIKFEAPFITINQRQDLLSPLLIIQFLNIVREIVKKGLRKSYYPVQKNLYARIKGKILVEATIKTNLIRNKNLHTACRYEEFGLNSLENRVLKKALTFVSRYLLNSKIPHVEGYIAPMLNYIMPAFDSVSEDVNIQEVEQAGVNAFFQEYKDGIRLALLLLQRFGYNIDTASPQESIQSPPFWIDMSKLFELYVLGLLKDRFREIGILQYQFATSGNQLDILLNTEGYKMVIDAKYKPRYNKSLDRDQHLDIRQLSGYARLEKVFSELKLSPNMLIDCLIIYPDSSPTDETGMDNLMERNLHARKIFDYAGFYKLGIRLPTLPISAP